MFAYVMFATFSVIASSHSAGLILLQNDAKRAHFAGNGATQVETANSMSIQAPQIEQELFICNAYASPNAVDIVHVRTQEHLTKGGSLQYKECKSFKLPMQEGDQLDFKSKSLDIGTFYATGLPKSSSSLLLVMRRRSPHSTAVKFESHAFTETEKPQIAIIDAFQGKLLDGMGDVKIMEELKDASGKVDLRKMQDEGEFYHTPMKKLKENLKFNTVVAVNPGKYELSLASSVKKDMPVPLQAHDGKKYVLIRFGDEAEGKDYPQELIAFPSAATRCGYPITMTFFAVIMCISLQGIF